MRVAAVQVQPSKNELSRTLTEALGLVESAAKAGAEIVCLPEHWLLEHHATQDVLEREFEEWAERLKVWLIPGANYTNAQDGMRIESLLISPEGAVVGRQAKVHLFRGEKERAKAGDTYAIFDAGRLKVGIIVCYDNVFPEVARIVTLKGADILFLPSRIDVDGLEPWRLYIMTRALENRIPFVAPNVSAPPRFTGGSMVVDLAENGSGRIVTPQIVATIPTGPGFVIADIDVEKSRRLRSVRMADRRPETYREIAS